MVEFLLEHGANIEAKLYEGTTPLLRAIIEGHLETATLLLKKGADANVTLNGLTTLQLAMIGSGFANKNSNPEIVKLLLQYKLESHQIHLAACFGDIQKIEECLKDGTKIDEKDTANFTALHYAVSGGHVDVVKFLLSNGANVNVKSINGWTPLRFTLTAKMAELLIANGADVNISDNKGQTVLHGAVNQDHKRGNKELVELLVEHGADINAKTTEKSVDWEGWTPFHVTCRNGNLEIVELLIEHGADINAKTDKGDTPLSLAQADNRRAVVQLLRELGAEE
jgi:ankyrin repeat protein